MFAMAKRVVPVNPRKPTIMPAWCSWCGKAREINGYIYRTRSNAGRGRFFCNSQCSSRFYSYARERKRQVDALQKA